MPPRWVVETLDVVEHICPCLRPGSVDLPGHPLGFQGREEALHRRVVPDFTCTAHAACDPLLLKQLLGVLTGVLGGFNRSLQHLNHGGVYGTTRRVDAEGDG